MVAVIIGFLVLAVFLLVYGYITVELRSRLRLTEDPTWLLVDQPATGDQTVPLILFQTYHCKDAVPRKVAENLERYASEYERRLYDDRDATAFLETFFAPPVAATFRALKLGQHKADLLRYCLLYIYGGVYLDIKPELARPLAGLFQAGTVTSILSRKNTEIYQGVIAAPPRQRIFLTLIDGMVRSGRRPIYHLFIREFMRYIEWDTGLSPAAIEFRVHFGSVLRGKLQSYSLYREYCTHTASDCYDGLDQHGYCCHIQDPVSNEVVIKTRYADYPWRT